MREIMLEYMREHRDEFATKAGAVPGSKARDRAKAVYEEKGAYESITEAMTYNQDLFDETIADALRPENSPLPPPELAEDLEQERKQEADLHERLAEIRRRKEDKYRADVPLAEDFVTQRDKAEANHLAVMEGVLRGKDKAKEGEDRQ